MDNGCHLLTAWVPLHNNAFFFYNMSAYKTAMTLPEGHCLVAMKPTQPSTSESTQARGTTDALQSGQPTPGQPKLPFRKQALCIRYARVSKRMLIRRITLRSCRMLGQGGPALVLDAAVHVPSSSMTLKQLTTSTNDAAVITTCLVVVRSMSTPQGCSACDCRDDHNRKCCDRPEQNKQHLSLRHQSTAHYRC